MLGKSSGCCFEEAGWFKLESDCVHCHKNDFTAEWGPRCFICCTACNHLGADRCTVFSVWLRFC